MKRDKTDALFSRYIKLLSVGYCKRCEKYLGVNSRGLHCAHFHSRGKKSVRWDRDNATALCYGCHRYLDQRPLEKAEFFKKILGNIDFDKLNGRALKPCWSNIEAIQADLKEKIKLLED